MKKLFLRFLLVLAGFAGLTISASAQAVDQVVVKIPFSFVAAGQTFPAGEYKISRLRDQDPTVLVLASQEKGADPIVLLTVTREPSHGKAQLYFTTAGDQHLLSRVETADNDYSLSVPHSEVLVAATPTKGGAGSSSSGSSGSN